MSASLQGLDKFKFDVAQGSSITPDGMLSTYVLVPALAAYGTSGVILSLTGHGLIRSITIQNSYSGSSSHPVGLISVDGQTEQTIGHDNGNIAQVDLTAYGLVFLTEFEFKSSIQIKVKQCGNTTSPDIGVRCIWKAL